MCFDRNLKVQYCIKNHIEMIEIRISEKLIRKILKYVGK